jgi:large conductance mechanosensitive channel
MRGNLIDMAVGIIIGAAFGKIISSFVNDIIMPPIGMLVGGIDFSNLGIVLREATDKTPAVILKYGVFVNTIVDFTIVAFAIFTIIKSINQLKRKEESVTVAAPPPPPAPREEVVLLTEIRDLLKK